LTVDDIEDLRLAVDEACALLLPYAQDGASLDAHFVLADGELTVDTSVPSPDGEPDRSGLGWTVLRALATTAEVRRDADHLIITVTKTTGAAAT
jgi:serine/threonine-protein kinase RsbW